MNTNRAKERYLRDGFVVRPDILTIEHCDTLTNDLLRWFENQSISENHYGILFHNLYAEIPSFLTLLEDGILQREAEVIYGSSLVFFQDNLIWKPPSSQEAINWHQDYSYWPLSKPSGITLWLALDDATLDNGCLQFCRHSHRQGECIPNDFIANTPAQWATSLPTLKIQQHDIQQLTLAKGSVSLHHPLVAHTSAPNTSHHHRRAWSITFVDPNIQWDFLHAPHPYRYQFSCNTEDLPKEQNHSISLCPPPIKKL